MDSWKVFTSYYPNRWSMILNDSATCGKLFCQWKYVNVVYSCWHVGIGLKMNFGHFKVEKMVFCLVYGRTSSLVFLRYSGLSSCIFCWSKGIYNLLILFYLLLNHCVQNTIYVLIYLFVIKLCSLFGWICSQRLLARCWWTKCYSALVSCLLLR